MKNGTSLASRRPRIEKSPTRLKKTRVKPNASLDGPAFSPPNFASRKQALPELPSFKDHSDKNAGSNEFAYAPIADLRKALRSESKPSVPPQTQGIPVAQLNLESPVITEASSASKFVNPINKSLPTTPAAKAPRQSFSASPQSVAAQQRPVTRKQLATFAEFEQPTMQTDFSVPQAPAMMEGVVKIAETTVPSVEGRLVAAEQPIDDSSVNDSNQSSDTIQKQLSRTDRLLEGVNFFEQDNAPAPSAPRTFAVAGQPVPQSQIVINLNTDNANSQQPAKQANQAIVIQPNQGSPAIQVALASSNSAVGNQAAISQSDVASAVQSKYALKGKCPVTLLTEGRWVDGNKQIGCVHRDRVYLFVSADQREAFLANPDKLSPLLAGFDPVIFEETGKLIEGEEKFGTFMGKKPNQRIVLFKTADTRDRFQSEPSKYIEVVRKAMASKAPKETKLR